MSTEPFGAELIERYLRTRSLQYFRGQHDDEYFFILNTDHGRVHVHLEIPQADRDAFTIRLTPARFFPAAHRSRLMRLINRRNRTAREAKATAKAVVYRSSDPQRIGVAAESSVLVGSRIGFEDFTVYVDRTIDSAVHLLGEINARVGSAPAPELPKAC